MSIWNNPETLDSLEVKRNLKRKHQRICFDCFNAICRKERVYCIKGNPIGQSKNGTAGLITILNGTTPKTCTECADYTD